MDMVVVVIDNLFSFFRVLKEAEANKLKLTPEYLELKFIEAIANNSKMFFGNKVRWSIVGGSFSSIITILNAIVSV